MSRNPAKKPCSKQGICISLQPQLTSKHINDFYSCDHNISECSTTLVHLVEGDSTGPSQPPCNSKPHDWQFNFQWLCVQLLPNVLPFLLRLLTPPAWQSHMLLLNTPLFPSFQESPFSVPTATESTSTSILSLTPVKETLPQNTLVDWFKHEVCFF